ncbi:DUF4232 domain-containing protein [Kutzneria albida]|uniref:DUF4232 domain-containing protein n=1 Tax=Kutzneria albida DSM 43870 TaxID=1449976 RepID=W5VZM3_9PSEU|nr:DUF4232 domain-containing protein [Kutzneria albida]AHH94027.1 hypothetical protein KALB_652 [Kutzneria albida DSM 43870]
MVRTRTTITAALLGTATCLVVAGCGGAQPTAASNKAPLTPSTPAAQAPATSVLAPSSTAVAAPPSSTATAPPEPSGSPETATATLFQTPRTIRCSAGVLSGKITDIAAGVGQRTAHFTVTNTGASTCTLYGYGGFALVGADGKAVPTSLKWVARPGPSLVSLAPGHAAAMTLHWSVVADGSESDTGPCEPTATKIESIPPDETEPMTAAWTFGQVCGRGAIESSAFYPV